jgi:hypothetical protein
MSSGSNIDVGTARDSTGGGNTTSRPTCPDGSGDVKAMTSSESATETLPVDVNSLNKI